MRFKIIGGGYTDAKGKYYPRGSIVESDERLDVKFINKIVLVSELPSVSDILQPDITTSVKVKEKTKKDKGPKTSSSPAGKKKDETGEKDVTKKFPEASEAGFSVIRIAKNQYNVIDTDDNSVTNDKLLKQKEVADHIQSLIVDDDDDDDDD